MNRGIRIKNGLAARVLAIAAAALLGSCAGTTSAETTAASASPRTLIQDVTVIPMNRPGRLARQDVIVAGDRIVSIGPSGRTRARPFDRVVDGRGKFLMPGLWDMHVHAILSDRSETVAKLLPLYLSWGIVGVRDLGSTLDELQAVRGELASRPDLPALVAPGPLLDGPRQPWMQRIALPLNSVEEARAAAERLADGGVDFLKIYNNLSPDQYRAVAEVAQRRGLPIAGHVPFRMTVEQVSAAGQKSIEHAGLQLVADCIPDGAKAIPAQLSAWIKDGYPGRYKETGKWWARRDRPACSALYERMARRGTWVTPTLVNEIKGGGWTSPEDLAALPKKERKACENSVKSIDSAPALRDGAARDVFALVRELHQAGVPLLAGSDVPNECLWHGSSLHKELGMLREAGLSNWEVLRTATVNPARYLGRADEGAVRPGAIANLLLLDADPLVDITNTRRVAGVMLRGRWHDPSALAAMRGGGDPVTTLYENGSVWTGTGFERRTLAVRDGAFIDPAAAGETAARVDLAGGFVVPPYGNAHVHVTPANAAGSWSFVKDGTFYAWNTNTIVMDAKALDFFARKDSYDVAVAQGGITEPGGHPEKLYVELLSQWVPSYRGMKLADFLGNAFHYGRDKAEIDRTLDLLKRQNAGLVKAYLLGSEAYFERRDDPRYYGSKGLDPVNFAYLVAAARARGLSVAVHVETVHDLKIAALSGAAVAAHLPAYSGSGSEEALRRRTLSPADASLIARSGIKLVPTYALAAGTFREAEKAGKLDKSLQARVYATQAENMRLLAQAGARFLIGTDTGGAIHDEVEHLVAIGGLTHGEALAAALGTGRQLFPARRLGCFDPGCEADFLLLGADPSSDIAALRAIRMRIKGGKPLEPPAQDKTPADSRP